MAPSDAVAAFQVPVERATLANGLRVVVSPERAAPVVCVAVYYGVGMRLEPRGRTGFAHLFEHLMFQGSPQMAKMELVGLVQANGGLLNGSTRTDFTNYFEVMPSHTLELALWMEADRMRGPVITQTELDNQRDVVKNEIRVNVLNRPYGSFPWIDMQERAFTNWHNAHNGYGDMVDLDAASMADVREFFDTYYSPANAVLVVVGDADPSEVFAMARRYFEGLPAAPPPPEAEIGEPRQEEERRFSRVDPLAPAPALAIAYHTPPVGTPEYYAMGLLHQALAEGDDSLLHAELVSKRGYASEVDGGINFLGHMHNARTPLLWCVNLVHDTDVTPNEIIEAFDEVVERLREHGLDAAALARARTKARASLFSTIADQYIPGFGLADLLAAFELIEGDASHVNELDARFKAVTPELVAEVARDYLRRENRVILELHAGAPTGAEAVS
ncbi:MAG: insulinase family protein [Dehalococcoidia bacterium]|nr:MAG: insulinase family protein [Dehalococcoidia bacterium]